MAAATALSPLQTLRNLFGSQTPSKPSVPIHCPTYHSRPLPLPNPATKLTDPASSTSAATTLSDDKHRIIVGARMTNAELLSDDSTATTSIPKRIIINASGKIVEYQFPAGRLTIKEEPPDVLLVRPDVDPQVRNLGKPVDLAGQYYEDGADEVSFLNITGFRDFPLGDLPMLQILRHTSEHVFVPLTVGGGIRDFTDGNGRYYSSLEVASEYFWSGADKVSIGSDAVFAAEEYLRTGVKTGKSSIEQISQRYGNQAVVVSVDPRRVYLRSPNEVQFKAVKLATPGPLGEEYAWYQCTVDYFGDAGSPLLNYIDGIQARSSYLTVGGGLGINHYNGGNIPPMLMDLNNTACDFVPSQGGPLMIEHTNRIFRRMCCSHQILWISLLMAGSLLLFHPCIRSIIKIIISFIHSSDGNYIKLDTLMSLMQFFGLGQSCAPLFCSVGITSETRKSPFKLLIMMMGAAWWLLGSFKGSKHDVNSALVRFKDNLATQQIPPPNTLLQLKFFLDFVTSGGGCTQISLFMVAIFHGKLFTVLAELFTVLAESSFWKKNLDQHLKLCFVIPKDSKLRDRVFMAKTIADIQNHGEGKYNDQLHVLFDPVISSRESALLTITCKLRAKNDDEYKASISDLQLIVEGGIKDALLYHGEAWPVQYFV